MPGKYGGSRKLLDKGRGDEDPGRRVYLTRPQILRDPERGGAALLGRELIKQSGSLLDAQLQRQNFDHRTGTTRKDRAREQAEMSADRAQKRSDERLRRHEEGALGEIAVLRLRKSDVFKNGDWDALEPDIENVLRKWGVTSKESASRVRNGAAAMMRDHVAADEKHKRDMALKEYEHQQALELKGLDANSRIAAAQINATGGTAKLNPQYMSLATKFNEAAAVVERQLSQLDNSGRLDDWEPSSWRDSKKKEEIAAKRAELVALQNQHKKSEQQAMEIAGMRFAEEGPPPPEHDRDALLAEKARREQERAAVSGATNPGLTPNKKAAAEVHAQRLAQEQARLKQERAAAEAPQPQAQVQYQPDPDAKYGGGAIGAGLKYLDLEAPGIGKNRRARLTAENDQRNMAQIVAATQQGASIEDIAAEMGFPVPLVQEYLTRAQVQLAAK